MKGIHFLRPLALLLFTGWMATAGCAHAEERSRSIGCEIKVQRACEAAIWAMRAVSIYDIELSIQRDLGGKFGDVVYFAKPMESRQVILTANDVTPYVISARSTKDGPLMDPLTSSLLRLHRQGWGQTGFQPERTSF